MQGKRWELFRRQRRTVETGSASLYPHYCERALKSMGTHDRRRCGRLRNQRHEQHGCNSSRRTEATLCDSAAQAPNRNREMRNAQFR